MKLTSLPMIATLLTCALTNSAPAESPTAAASTFRKQIGEEKWQHLQTRLEALNKDIAQKGILAVPGQPEKLLTGYAYGEFYDWDLYFENVYLSYYGISDYCFTNFKAFLAIQQPSGFIPRMLKRQNPQMFKPFLAQIAVLGSKQRGDDYEWLRESHYGALRKYIDCWFQYDTDHNGLPVWDSADASGMDNQERRAGHIGSYESEGVDLACELHREMQAMAVIAGKLGKPDDQQEWRQRAEKLAKLIDSVFWDEQDGFYYDRHEKSGKLTKVKSVSGFLPLWAGVASPAHAKRIIEEHLVNKKEFWLKYPVASYAVTEPDYSQIQTTTCCNWRGTAWIPTNYMIMHGLIRYGYNDLARELADRTFRMVLDENPATREYYNGESGEGHGMNPFWGWSSLAYVMPLECISGYDPTNLDAPLLAPLRDDPFKIRFPKK